MVAQGQAIRGAREGQNSLCGANKGATQAVAIKRGSTSWQARHLSEGIQQAGQHEQMYVCTRDFTHEAMKEAVLEAMGEEFPWTGALAGPTQAYIATLAHAANAPPKFVLSALLATVAVAMGLNTTDGAMGDYREPVNLFVLCIGPGGSGTTQSLHLTVQQPLKHMFGSWTRQALLDDFTHEGFQRQLSANNGRVVLASDKVAALFENLDKNVQRPVQTGISSADSMMQHPVQGPQVGHSDAFCKNSNIKCGTSQGQAPGQYVSHHKACKHVLQACLHAFHQSDCALIAFCRAGQYSASGDS